METFSRDFPDQSLRPGLGIAPAREAALGVRGSSASGEGFSKTLIAKALEICRELGEDSASLLTQTPCWVAICVYHRFGFCPEVRSEENVKG